jgi:essential nuclear protein 1
LDDRIVQLYKEYVPYNLQASFIPLCATLIVQLLVRRVGQLLRRYTSGKIPKALKRIPSLECWAQVLQLTQPEHWSPNAVYQATRLFSSNMNTKNAVRFYEAILLPRIRNDIKYNKRLHFALYQAMKKSLYKPAAFFKGILLPLCQVVLVIDLYLH